MFNEDIAQGKWKELKGEIQKAWGNITGDELEKTKGDLKSIAGIIQQKYGIAKEDASTKLAEMANRTSTSFSQKTEELKTKVADIAENTKEALKRTDKH